LTQDTQKRPIFQVFFLLNPQKKLIQFIDFYRKKLLLLNHSVAIFTLFSHFVQIQAFF